MLPRLRDGGLYVVGSKVPCSVVPLSEFWERVLVYGEAGSALLHSDGSVMVFCMSSCVGVTG